MGLTHAIDIVGAGATAEGLSRTVKGEIRIHTGLGVVDADVQAMYRETDLKVYALLSQQMPDRYRQAQDFYERHQEEFAAHGVAPQDWLWAGATFADELLRPTAKKPARKPTAGKVHEAK